MNLFTRYILIFLFSIFSAFSVKGQVAGFTESVTSGCSPLVVHFTNTSTGATTFKWTFGNSDSSTLDSTSTSYLAAGTYTVTLIAYSASGTASAPYTAIITVYPAPTVNFTASDTGVCPGQPVTYTSTGSAGVTGAVTYSWNMGDGYSSSAASPTHAFTTPGYKTITLSVTNGEGCVATLVKPTYIDVYSDPIANFIAASTFLCNPPTDDVFNNESVGAAPMTYEWSFGDGGSSTAADPTHSYATTGSYSVKLIITDAHGCKDTSSTSDITVGNLTASFTAPASACVLVGVPFDNTTTGAAALESTWYFGDGGVTLGTSPTYAYNTAGTYTVTLVEASGSCADTVSHVITIYPEPPSSFTSSPVAPCPAPVTVSYTSTTPAGSTVTWEFGSGTASGATATHTYSSDGPEPVTMIVTDIHGCKDTVTVEDTVYNLTLGISHAIDSTGCVPLTIPFSAFEVSQFPTFTTGYPYGVASYTWNYGDGSPTSTAATPSHTYTAEGTYTVTLNIITANGCVGTAEKVITVGLPPNASFTAAPTTICNDGFVTFTNTTPNADSFTYVWDFGDNGGSTEQSVTHVYTYPDTAYTVTLYASYNGCVDTFKKKYYITVDSPKAVIAITYPCNPEDEVHFADSSLGDNAHEWFFGDGTTSTAADPIHEYSTSTTYDAMLTTYNALSGCRDTARVLVNLVKPVPRFTANDTAICKDGVVTFDCNVSSDTAAAYYWYIDGLLQPFEDSTFTDTFTATGIYNVMLIIKDRHSCYDTLNKPGYLTVAKPADNFTVAPPSGCWPLSAVFTDASTDVPGVTLTNFTWLFGDGGTTSVTSTTVTHTYTSAGDFSVEEVVTDNLGCKDTLIRPSIVTVYRPHAVFSASNTHPCVNVPVTFTNTTMGVIDSAYWLFGDDSTSTLTSPTHTYKTPGTYTVKLIVVDTHGCDDTATYTSYIDVTGPDASFYMTDSFSICVPLSVTFVNTSIGATSYQWFLGDGSTSILMSPTDLYTTGGYDTILLVAKNTYGCVDTAVGHITLFGGAGGFAYGPISGCTPVTVKFGANISNVPNIIWDFADGSTSAASYSDSITHTYSIPGAYVPKLVLSDNTGCEQSSQGLDTIKVDGVIPGFTTTPNPVCIGIPFVFKDTSFGYFAPIVSWHWTFASGDTSSIKAPSFIYPDVGTFTTHLQVTDGWGCSDSVTEDVLVYPPPVITVSQDTTVCVGDPAELTGYGGVSYTWLPAATVSCSPCTTTDATPAVVTQYTVTGTDVHGCQNTDTVTVFLRTTTTGAASGDTSMCLDDAVVLSDSGGTKYTWIPEAGLSDPHIATPIASPTATTTYEVISQLGDCIPDTNYLKVIVYPLPTVFAGDDQSLIAGSQASLNATGTLIEQYAWSPSITLSCNTCSSPVASMSVTTTYIVSVTSFFGCRSSDSVTIHLYCDKSQVFIPNTFTPNGDGQNDVFYPRGTGISFIKSFRIYNRWGELLFERSGIEANDASNAWDGSYNGGPPRPDVYVYIIDAICETGEPINLKGDVTIIR